MERSENRDYRPEMHFTPKKGWTNDPNGLFLKDGVWHLFAQHNPLSPKWNVGMHWLHATSKDLLTWKDQGLALAPEEKLGSIFSGSAVIDCGNTSGLGKGGDPIVLMYTSHGEYEQQSIAYSNDGMHFIPYSGNPVIPNTEKIDFRDPKVFRNDILDCWTVVLAAGDHVEFYASKDLIHWDKTGEFGREEKGLGGIFECPDLFPLRTEDGEEYWILMSSMLLTFDFGGSRTQYFVGEFDGRTFRQTVSAPNPLMVDSGYDNYAQTTFFGTSDKLMMGWAANPGYAGVVPTGEYRGLMTYARRLSLVKTKCGIRLAGKPVAPESSLTAHFSVPQGRTPEGWMKPEKAEAKLKGELFNIRVETDGPFVLVLSNPEGDILRVALDNSHQFTVDRSESGIKDFSDLYESGLMSVAKTERLLDGPVTLDLYFDHMIAEIFADEGTFANTTLVFPKEPYTEVALLGSGTLWTED